MPKMKSRRAAMKRYRFTAKGKVKFQRPGRRHNMHVKGEERKRALNHPNYLTTVDAEKAKRQLPYGSR